MSDVQTGKDKRYGLAEQTTFGTAEIDGIAVDEIETEHFSIDPKINFRQSENARATRNAIYNDAVVDIKGSAPVFSISTFAKKLELAKFLYAHMQSVTEVGTGTMAKTFVFPATQPDFAANAGFYATWFERYPVAATSWKILDAISEQITISAEPGEEDRLKIAQNWKGREVPSDIFTADPDGTWTVNPNDNWYLGDIARSTINVGAGDLTVAHVGAMEIVLSHDVIPVGQNNGSFENFGIVNRKGSFKLTILKGSNSQAIQAAWMAGTPATINLGWGNATPGTVDKDLDITFTAKIEKCVPTNEDIQGVEITGQILAVDRTAQPITIIMADSVLQGW